MAEAAPSNEQDDMAAEWAAALEQQTSSAPATEVMAPAQPASPQPLEPSGLVVAGTGWLCQLIEVLMSSARGRA